MLDKLSDDIDECYRHADECAHRAGVERDARLRQDFLDIEQRWLFLARSYEFSARLSALSTELDRRKNKEW